MLREPPSVSSTASSSAHRLAVRRSILALALPVVGSGFLERAVGLIDVFLVGGLGASAIAAVGASQLLLSIAVSLVSGLPLGTLVVTAQLWGAGKRGDASAGAGHVLLVGFIVGLIVGAAGMIWGGRGVALLGAAPDVVASADAYLRLVFAAFPLTLMVTMLTAMLQGTGDTKSPLFATVLMNVVHLIIAYPTIYGVWGAPALGVTGAAAAFAGADLTGVVVLAWMAHRRGLLRWAWAPEFLRAVLRVGSPASVDHTLQQSAQLVFARVVLLYGTTVYAAHQVGVTIESLSYLYGGGFALAAATAFGQSLGANNLPRARLENWEANRLAIIVMAAMGLVFFFFPYLLMRIFTSDQAVIDYGTLFLQIVAVLQIPLAITMVLSGSLKGAGDTRFLLLASIIGAWVVRVPLALLFGYGLHLPIAAVWMVMAMDWSVRMLLVVYRYRSERWQGRRMAWEN